jgi:hypothetical protein
MSTYYGKPHVYAGQDPVKDAFREGVVFAIKALRDLGETYNHLPKWSHSRELKFAPVELSDYILIKYKREHT